MRRRGQREEGVSFRHAVEKLLFLDNAGWDMSNAPWTIQQAYSNNTPQWQGPTIYNTPPRKVVAGTKNPLAYGGSSGTAGCLQSSLHLLDGMRLLVSNVKLVILAMAFIRKMAVIGTVVPLIVVLIGCTSLSKPDEEYLGTVTTNTGVEKVKHLRALLERLRIGLTPSTRLDISLAGDVITITFYSGHLLWQSGVQDMEDTKVVFNDTVTRVAAPSAIVFNESRLLVSYGIAEVTAGTNVITVPARHFLHWHNLQVTPSGL